MVLIGSAGMGKTALVRTLADDECLVVSVWPPPTAALSPAIGLVSGLVVRGADPGSVRLGAHGPIVSALLGGVTPLPSPGSAAHPVVAAHALVRLWASLAVPRRPLLVVEDVHWADHETWEFVARLAEAAPAAGCGLLITSRPEGRRWESVERLAHDPGVTSHRLGPLRPQDVARMVAATLDTDAAPPPGLLAQVDAAEGVPLLVEALLEDLVGSGSLRRGGESAEWTYDPGPLVPASIASVVGNRLTGLDAEARAFLERAALMGPGTDTTLVAASMGLDSAAAAALVRRGTDAHLLEIGPGTGRVAFRHELVREAVLAQAVDLQRADHARALLSAFGLDGDPGDPTAWAGAASLHDVLNAARLADLAGHPGAAALHLGAARRLAASGAPLAAAGEARASARSDTPDRMDAQLLLVESLALAGDVGAALEEAARLEALLTHLSEGPHQQASRAREAVARAVGQQGDWAEADRLLSESTSSSSLRALVALELGRYGEAKAVALAVLDEGPSAAGACEALEVLGRLARRSDLVAADAWFARAVTLAETAELPLWRARALHERATVAQLRTFAVAGLYDAREAAVTAGAPGLVTAVDFHLSALHGVRFEPKPALAAARRVLEESRRLGMRRQEAWAWILVGQGHAVSGDRRRAEAAGREALALVPDDAEVRGMALGTAQGLSALLAEDRAAALEAWALGIDALRRLPTVAPLPPWYLWPILATVADVEGDGGQRARSETEHGDLRVAPGLDALWHLASAVAAGRAGDLSAAERAAAAAGALVSGVESFDGWRLLALRWVAEDALAAGWGQPGQWMTEAAEFFGQRRFVPLASACRALARAAGAPQRRRGRGSTPVPPDLYRLGVTSREVDVLHLVADGLTNAEIGERLHLSPRTVKGYVEQLLAKTGTTNRTQLAGLRTDPDAR